MGKIYVTSDLHFGHNKDFLYKPRGFENIDEMNTAIIKNWNSIVTAADEVYVLGDLMLGPQESIQYVKQLNGRIHVVLGNHDSEQRKELYYKKCHNIVSVEYGAPLSYNGYRFYLTHYPTITSNNDFEKPLKSRVINLCGHTHTADRFKDWEIGYIYHVELDAHDNKPVLIDNIIDDIKQKVGGK